jgi:voltage-gated potassium channel
MIKLNYTELRHTPSLSPLQHKIHEIIFEADTFWGKVFDVVLLICIFLSVTVTACDSIESLHSEYGYYFNIAEWTFTILFTIEYFFRLYCVAKPWLYGISFFGIIDLMAILPSYLSLFIDGPELQFLSVIRILRFFRVFRLFKLVHFTNEVELMLDSLKRSIKRIAIFTFYVFIIVFCLGAVMYIIEGPENGFTSIPVSVYWAVVTLTTVGYGDISPKTPLGRTFSFFIMLLGYGIIAIPTGIVTSEMMSPKKTITTRTCSFCCREGHDPDAKFCKYCGKPLD